MCYFNLKAVFKNYVSKCRDYLKFKCKYNKKSYRTICIRSKYNDGQYSNIELDLVNRKIKLPKLGLVDIRWYRNLENISGRIINKSINILFEELKIHYQSI